MKNYFLISFLLIAISGAVFAQFIHPKFYEIKGQLDQLNFLEDTLNNNAQLIQLKDEKFGIYSSFSEDKIRAIKNSVPTFDSANVVISLLALDNLLAISGLPFDTSYSIGAEKNDGEDIVQLPITLTFSSINYTTLLKFIENLQNWDRSILINSISIREALNNPETSSSVRADITISLLFVNQKKILSNNDIIN